MVVLIILLILLVIICLILFVPITISWNVDTPADCTQYSLTWFGVTLYNQDGKGVLVNLMQKEKPPKEKEESEEEEEKPEESTKEKISRYWHLVQEIIPLIPKPLRYLCKGISLRQLVIGIQVGKFDAKDCALTYAATRSAVYSALGMLQCVLRVHVQQIQIQCAFGQEKSQYILRGKLRFCLVAAAAALLSFAIGYVRQKSEQPSATAVQEQATQSE